MIDSNLQPVQRAAMSVVEAAKWAGLGRTTLYGAISGGELRTLKVGGRRLVRPADLAAWLDAHAIGVGAPA